MGHRDSPVRRDDLTGPVSERWPVGFPDGISAGVGQKLVGNWLADIQRRGAKVYSVARTNGVLHLSLQGKARFQYSVQIDLDSQQIIIELDRPEWKWAKRERYLLSAGNLRLLAKRICPLPEGHAMVTVDLLSRLLLLCGAYRRLLPEPDREHHSQFTPKTISELESELRKYLVLDERQKTGNRLLPVPPKP
jgi:hypothetical protein